HNLGLVKSLCSYVYIMYAGHIMEEGKVQEILDMPMHPYTKGLVAAIPDAGKRGKLLEPIPGNVPPIDARPEKGCVFCGRCPRQSDICSEEAPPCVKVLGRKIYCHLQPEEMEEDVPKDLRGEYY
ncbi:MAG: peptide ABC transporter ATP-binding protein, partial [Parasporobacterium sp.]|nr:peptide ABC transporter ATP-binding protein [Parasporobacterium sp.]